jgi:hypothetical protein
MAHKSKTRLELPPEQQAIRVKRFHPTGPSTFAMLKALRLKPGGKVN